MTVSRAQAKATAKYQKRVYTQVNYKIKKEFRQEIDEHIAKTGESIISFISRAVKNQIEIDNRIFSENPEKLKNPVNAEKAENESN